MAECLVEEGERVTQGQMLLSLDTGELEASLAVARANTKSTAKQDGLRVQFEMLKHRRTQIEKLATNGSGSPEELMRAKADEQVAYFDWQQAIDQSKLNGLRVKEIEQQQIRARQVFSTLNGFVTSIRSKKGEYVAASQPDVATVVDLTSLRAIFYLPTKDVFDLSVGQELQVRLVETKKIAIGKIEYIGLTTESDSGRVRVKVLIDNTDQKYRSGVRCQLVR